MIDIPAKIETRKTPLNGKELKDAGDMMRLIFDGDYLSMDSANRLYDDFFGRNMRGKHKSEKMANAINDFLFTEAGSFDKWFSAIPPDGQKILYAVTFEEYVNAAALEKILDKQITVKEKWGRAYLNPVYNLKFITVDEGYNFFSIGIPPLYRCALLPQFKPPSETLLENCLCKEAKNAAAYNNSAEITEFLPLFCEALNECFEAAHAGKSLNQLFSKKLLNGLYRASGLPPFPFETEKSLAPYSPTAADLLGRFLLFMTDFYRVTRPENPVEFLHGFTKSFFDITANGKRPGVIWLSEITEYNLFFSHLTKSNMLDQKNIDDIFSVRRVFMDSVIAIAEDGRSFDAKALVKRAKYLGRPLSFFTNAEVRYLKIKADKIYLLEQEIEKDSWEYFHPYSVLYFEFIEKPLFLGYFYLFAALGVLEITQEPPVLICENKGKMTPASSFDSLKTVKITEFGRWCMGVSKDMPAVKKTDYEAIADNELYLVTVRGKSLERTIFLDRIGEKLGENRWRVNPATFIAGCENRAQINDRVNKFYSLIDPAPAPHWEKLFETVAERADFLGQKQIDALVYQLPFDTPAGREVSAEILADPELSGTAMRAEGGLLVVPYRNEKRFYALLAAHGISRFDSKQ
jgi:hypothetical protein